MIKLFCIASLLFFYGCGKNSSKKQLPKGDCQESTKAEEDDSSAFCFEKLDHFCPEAPDLLLTEILNNTFFQLTGITLPIDTKIICAPCPVNNSSLLISEQLLPQKNILYKQYLGQSRTSLPQLHSYFQQLLAQNGWHYKNRKTELVSIFEAKKINLTLTLIIRPHDNNAEINNLHFLVKEKTKTHNPKALTL